VGHFSDNELDEPNGILVVADQVVIVIIKMDVGQSLQQVYYLMKLFYIGGDVLLGRGLPGKTKYRPKQQDDY